ncbi:putative O-methyltransferase YrrM [Winogradskyella epiphytica]|uniref:Putative O-methyltransferase YrrM n=1 Tax=Winogradskyella epiphytica TaxID=262005 RepID=A0A2V4X953_9FLAO|nr:class I SAM-dependent methyltransferase [Winogradskyella epiphytica]PYE82159.1 putative O-methyltransferase YrrM [Winogradskyella epiphytica]GGW60151.1 O-methyltransferase [Winogradskyella epiphytica]
MYQFLAYIKFIFTATNQHGVHSPFIYNFVTKCLYDKTNYDAYTQLNNYRKRLKTSKVTLEVKDLGEGSKVLDDTHRSVSDMVKTSSSSKKDTQLLYRLATYFNFNNILELGTSLGMGTYALALANPNSKITTIEGCKNTSSFAKTKLEELEINNVDCLMGNFSEVIPNLKDQTLDFIFFDGHHNKEATIQYFESLLSTVHNDTIFAFDDIYWSEGMTEAWDYIKNHHAVTVTVDCFHFGFVFFRKEQVKEHFKIRL